MLFDVVMNHFFKPLYMFPQDLLQIRSFVYAEEPNIDIHNFIGTFTRVSACHCLSIAASEELHSFETWQNPHCLTSFFVFYIWQEDGDPPVNESLSIENTLWASTVIASGNQQKVISKWCSSISNRGVRYVPFTIIS